MPTALYRRYRPESFADVIGQEHVTAPLMQALRTDRTNHAYLFSGPRGCGKTTSARILARCLNCTQGPTDTPCGTCESCVDLARDGGGSLDVVEIDAASHGGVDDARELRERAAIAPARDRYKIFIVDEAHMVTNQGFNAMLKLVEEPPPHVKFVFATTEPDKVLPTIRSRTHHYPFHLVAPDVLSDHLTTLAAAENVPVGPGVIPLVVRAGGGSVRDSLSVLDQLIAGADESGLDQTRAAALLGYTEGSLLDDVMGALSAVDGAALFGVVDRVLSTGQDPRRFIEDLLTRLRDLIVVAALKERADTVLRGYPQDQLERLAQQAGNFKASELSRAADVVNEALADMVGTSGPRIQLELLCARLLLPAVDGAAGYGARLDRMERLVADGRPAPGDRSKVAAPGHADDVGADRPSARPSQSRPQPEHRGPPDEGGPPDEEGRPERQAASVHPTSEEPRQALAVPQATPSASGPSTNGGDNTETLRRFWPDILNAVRRSSRATWSIIQEQAQVLSCSGGVLELGIANPGALRMFLGRSTHAETLARAIQAQTNLAISVEAVPFDRGGAPAGPDLEPAPLEESPRSEARTLDPAASQVETQHVAGRGQQVEPESSAPFSTDSGWPEVRKPPHSSSPSSEAPTSAAGRPSRAAQMAQAAREPSEPTERPGGAAEDAVSADDPDAEDSGMFGAAVVERVLGGQVIDDGQ